eukprot:Skav226297  [mRNA]  locus=scaffold3301:304238:304444:+ [translate_table: standard]
MWHLLLLELWECWLLRPPMRTRPMMLPKVLSEKSYPLLKEIDWTSKVYAKLPPQKPFGSDAGSRQDAL